MISGSKERFAIEAEPLEVTDGWILGRFRFWICNQPVGNWDDFADLRGCVRWLREFATESKDRFEPSLANAPPEEVFVSLYESTMTADSERKPVEAAYARFFVSHLGMSSMEAVDILLLYDEHGGERLIWRSDGSSAVRECRLWRREMEDVAADFCDQFERVAIVSR
jgi:hypothetical protein